MATEIPFTLMIAKSLDKHRPSHVLLHAVQGWGKTSFAAMSPNPLFLMSKNETGLLTLMQNRQIPDTPWIRFPRRNGTASDEAEGWIEVLNALKALLREEHPYKTLCLDTMNGLERLCHEHTCQSAYNGDWSATGFLNFQNGYETALNEWQKLLNLLEKLRTDKGMGTFVLCHTQIKNQRNPLGPDYDRFLPNLHRTTWGVTHGWADMCLFGRFDDEATKERGKGKAIGTGGKRRILCTTRSPGWDAKHRHGLPDEIELSSDGSAQAWQDFMAALKGEAA